MDSWLWSIKKQKWIQGPTLPEKIFNGKVVNVNKTFSLLLFPDQLHNKACITAYAIMPFLKFRKIEDCYFEYESHWSDKPRIQLSAEPIIFKDCNPKILLMVVVNSWDPNETRVYFDVKDISGESFGSSVLQVPNLHNAGLFQIRGILYHYQLMESNVFQVYRLDFNNLSSMIHVQDFQGLDGFHEDQFGNIVTLV